MPAPTASAARVASSGWRASRILASVALSARAERIGEWGAAEATSILAWVGGGRDGRSSLRQYKRFAQAEAGASAESVKDGLQRLPLLCWGLVRPIRTSKPAK